MSEDAMMRSESRLRVQGLGAVLAAIAGLGACGGGGDGGPPQPTVLTVTPLSIEFPQTGQQQTITAFPVDRRGSPVDVTVTFSSSNPTVASLSGQTNRTAVVTGVAAGTATITATTGGLTATTSVTVRCRVQFGAPQPAVLGALFVNLQQTITIAVTADPGCSSAVSWSSSNTAVASVDQTGKVTGVSAGQATITIRSVQDPNLSVAVSVTVLAVTSVSLPPSAIIDVQGQLQLTAATNPTGAPLEWSSSNPQVASVSQAGLVTGVADGTAIITATATSDRSKSAQTSVRVRGRVISVAVNPTSAQLAVPNKVTIVPTVTADPGVDRSVTWSTSNQAVATVDANGEVTAVGQGQATITATAAADQARKGSATINVTGRVLSVVVSPTNATLQLVGSPQQFTATVTADPGVNAAVTWSAAPPGVVTVTSATGLVTAVALGTATITATSVADATRSGSASVTVTATQCTPSGIGILPSPVPVMNATLTQQFTATFSGCAGTFPVIWESSNPAVLSVNNAGTATAMARGTATLTVKLGSNAAVQASVAVTVRDVTVSVTPTTDSIRVGWQTQLTASLVADAPLVNTYACTSDNVTIATVNAGTCLVTGIGLGTATITVRSTAIPARTATATIKVGTSCEIPLRIASGQTVNGTVNASSCFGNREIWSFTTAPAALTITGNAAFTYDFAPVVSNAGWFFWRNQAPTEIKYAIVTSGTWRTHIDALAGGGAASLTLAPWNWQAAGCPYFVITTNLSVPGLPLSSGCWTNYQPSGTVGTFYSQQSDLLPQLQTGQALTVTMNTSGFEPRIDILSDGGAVVASGVALAGQFALTVTYTPATPTFVRLRLSSRNALATGTITSLVVQGPSGSLMIRNANAFMSGTQAEIAAPGGGCPGGGCSPPSAAVRSGPAPVGRIREVSPAPPGRRQ